MDRFNEFIEIILKSEGGYNNDPDDLGGETKYGITKRRYPDLDIKNLTINQAKELYYNDIYLQLNLQYIPDDELALHVFDMAINAGRMVAIKLLQELLIGLEIDGVLGPVTGMAAANASMYVNLVEAYKAKRIQRYYLVSTWRNNQKFLAGWVNRVNNTKLYNHDKST